MPKLNQPDLHIARTPHLVQFEREFENLNSFYWVYRAATAFAYQESTSYARVTEFVPREEASHLDITTVDFALTIPKADLVARYGILAQVVTYYEVYLEGALYDLVKARWPVARNMVLRIRPSELPSNDLEAFIKDLAIKAEVKSVIDEGYSKRTKRISNLLQSNGCPEPHDPSNARASLVLAACELRNCIVHVGGRVDQRAFEALGSYLPGLHVGDQCNLEESILWKLVGAVRDDARAIDYAIRKNVADKKAARRAKRRRNLSARKARNLEQMRRFSPRELGDN